MTPIATPQLAPVASNAPARPMQLQLGQVLSGTVIALLNDATLRLQTPAGLLDVTADTPLATGTQVVITVQGTARQPELVVTPVQDGSSQGAAQQGGSSSETGGAQLDANSGKAISTAATFTNSSAAGVAETGGQSDAPARTTPLLAQAALSAAAVIVRDAAAAQGSLTTLFSNLEAAVAAPSAVIPAPVLDAAKQLLGMRLDIASGDSIDANDVKIALMRSGLVTNLPVAGAPPQNAGATDLGAALIVLRQTLKNWFDQDSDPKTAATPQNPVVTPASPRANIPMPPYRGGPNVPQAPSAPSLSASTPTREQAIQLLGQTDSAIARQTLLHIVSLPADQTSGTAHGNDNSSRLMFEIPVATAQGTGVVPMAIERDGGNRDPHDAQPHWRASFSVDLESIGPVHVRIALTGARASVTLKAERARSAELLSAGLPLLDAGLRKAEIEPGELRCHAGTPRPQAAMPGTFLDQAS
jgi:Flagellar hook-length control protein FliK